MGKLNFSDGVQVNTDGPLRVIHLSDGWYVVGQGMLIPVKGAAEAKETVKELREN